MSSPVHALWHRNGDCTIESLTVHHFLLILFYMWCHVNTSRPQLLSLGATLSMKIPRLKHAAIVSPQCTRSPSSFSSTFLIKPLLAKALHKNTQRVEALPAALGTALQYHLDFISRQSRLFAIPHHKWNIFCVLQDELISALWFDSRVLGIHLYAKHTDEATTYH